MGRPAYRLFVTVDNDPMGIAHDGVVVSGTHYSRKISPKNLAYGLQVNTTGTLTGTWTVWYSNKENPSEADDTDWVQDTSAPVTNPAGATTKWAYDAVDFARKWARLKYVNSGGAGSIFAYA